VARVAASTPRLLTAPGALESRVSSGAALVEVVDRRGRIVARSGALGGRILPNGPPLSTALHQRHTGYADAQLGSEPIRVYAAPLGQLGGGAAAGGAVLVAGTTADIDSTLDAARRLVLLCALAAAALAALLVTLLTRRALRPLARLSSGARAIARSADPAERLPAPAARDEVGELAGTLNAMLASLERAREAERRFVADASHELRTPLTALRGNAAYVARHGSDPDVLADIEADAARLSGLLDDLLALAREDASAPPGEEEVGLADVARAAAEVEPRAAVVIAPGAEGIAVRGERPALERAVGNLVRNAREHGPDGGRITVTVARDGDRARGGGSGLGLAIVRATAERHGGGAEAAGASFTIALPALRELSRSGRTTAS
jgi:signal transduction histidine kinase